MDLLPLSPTEELFCANYVKTRDLGRSYEDAFRPGPDVPRTRYRTLGNRTLQLAHVSGRIDELMSIVAASDEAVATVAELARFFLDIAKADPNELIAMKVGACRYCWGEGHAYQWREREYLEALTKAETQAAAGVRGVALPDPSGGFGYQMTRQPCLDCPECEGEGLPRVVARDTEELSPGARLLYLGVKQTPQGVQVMMADRMKALENLGRILGAFEDKVAVSGVINHAHAHMHLIAEGADPEAAARTYRDMMLANG